MRPTAKQINHQAQLMGFEVIKKGKKFQVFAGEELVTECPTLLHVQSYFFSLLPVSPQAIARQAFNTKSAERIAA